MKRTVAACFLLLTAIAIAVWADFAFGREMNALEYKLNNLIEASENGSKTELYENAEKIVCEWEKSSGLLRSIVLHDGIDELGRCISSLPQIIEYSGNDEMKKMCIEAINMIKNLRECEMIRIENIL